MISTGTGFKVLSRDSIDERFILSKDQMLNIDEAVQPENYFCVCTDDSMLYVYNVNNPVDAETGKFRKVGSNESVDPSIFQKSNDDSLITEDKTIVGAINELENNKLDKPETEGSVGQILVLQDDGSLAYQDNVSEFDDTEIRELIDTKLDKPETDGVAGQILVLQDDGSLAYADNVSEFDDTEIQEAVANKLDKPEIDGSAGQILVLQDDGSLAYADNVSEFDDTELRELIDTKLDKPETEGNAGQVLTVQEDGTNAYQDVPQYDDTELQEAMANKLNKPEVDGVAGQILVLQDDNTLSYADNVTEYDDTEIRELIDTKLDKEKVVQNLDAPDTESVLSTEGLNTALETKVDKVEDHSLVADTEIAKIHEHTNQDVLDKLSESDLGKLLYDGNPLGDSADAGGTADWTTNVALGVLAANTNVTGLTALEILRKATVKYEEPTATVTFSQSNTVIKQGVTFNLDITVNNPVKKTSDIEKFDLYKAGTLVESIPYASGTTSYSFTQIPDVAADCSYEVRVIDVQGKYTKYTKSYDFVYPFYTGCTDDIPVDATGLTEMIEAKGNKTITVNSGTGAYIVFMYDAAYGDIKNIIDPSGFENITSFTKIQLTIDGILYNCYHSNLKQALSNFKYTYKF